jgi:hypothetical protein
MILAAGTRTSPADPPARDWCPGVGAMRLGLGCQSPRATPDPFGVHDDHRRNSAAEADPHPALKHASHFAGRVTLLLESPGFGPGLHFFSKPSSGDEDRAGDEGGCVGTAGELAQAASAFRG